MKLFGFGYNKEKSRAAAERYLQTNKLQNAINEYEKILAAEPNDLAILNTVGDIYSRLGQNEKAIERFRVIAEAYAKDGVLLKSIAMYRKIVKLDPNGLDSMEKLAELYRKQGLVSDARSMLLQAADAYTRKGLSKETLRLLKQLVLFDPENVQVITRTADLMNQAGQKGDAQQMLAQSATTLISRQAFDAAQKVLDRLIALDRSNMRAQELRAQVTLDLGDSAKSAELYEAIPDLDSRPDGVRNLLTAYLNTNRLEDALPVARKLVSLHNDASGVVKLASRLYKENNTVGALELYSEFSTVVLAHDKEEVIAHLHGAVSRVRNNPDALQSVYELFRRAGESSMIAEVLELLAHACVQSEQFERARKAYKELIELEPSNNAHVQGYRQVCAKLEPGSVEAQPEQAKPHKAEDEPRTLDEFLANDEPALPSQKYPSHVEEQVAAALSEAEICESFSSKARGINALEVALQTAPDDLRLNRTLAMLYRQEGQPAKAARCYTAMQQVLESMGELEAASYYANLAGVDQTTTWEVGEDIAATDPTAEAGSTEEIDLSGEWESVWQDTAKPAAAEPVQAPAPAAAKLSPQELAELVEEARFCVAQQFWAEAEKAISRIASAAPDRPELAALRAQLPGARGSASIIPAPPASFGQIEVIEVSELDTLPGQPAPAPIQMPPAPAAAPTLSSLAAELDLELGDSFAPVAKPRREATPPAAVRPAVAPPPPAAIAPPTIAPDILPFMAAEIEPAPAERPVPEAMTPSVFGDLLQEFERDLASPSDETDDPETHFNLGIAFREMGLLDEAIGELQKVCKMAGHGLNPARAQQAYIWLATCFVEKSVPEASFKWYERALESAPDEDSRTAVNYELASAYEAAGHKREALEHFMEVYGTNIDYRDVASRIRELRSST